MIRLHLNIGTLKIGQVRTMRRWNYEESNFWCGKAFDGSQIHMSDLIRKCNFGPDYYFESGPKLHIRTV